MAADGTLFGELRGRAGRRLRVVDLFCGAGGTSLGVEMGLGVSPVAAVNHWDYAITTHQQNHPSTLHFREDVFNVAPWEAARGMSVDLLVGSPDCTHFSVAKGGAPRDTGRRALADVFIKWAREIRPRVIVLENVREFTGWGPLDDAGQPIRARRGEYFAAWVAALQAEGYVVEHQLLRACDYGAPTSRLRLFVVARRDGLPIRWPAPTHGAPGLPPHRAAAEVIDWSIPCPSIFDRARPLAEATQRRIAEGIRRFVIGATEPFIVPVGYGERPGQAPRCQPVTAPLSTVVGAGKHALIVPTLVTNTSGHAPTSLSSPVPTLTTGGQQALVSAFIARHFTGASGRELAAPLPTITTVDHNALVAATLVLAGQGERRPGERPRAVDAQQPLPTVTSGGNRFGVAAVYLDRQFGHSIGAPVSDPAPAITAGGGGKSALVAAFLQKFYGASEQNQPLTDPLGTVTTRDRFALTTVHVGGEPYQIVDIGMRMLQPRELARAQGFPGSYIFSGSKTDQIAAIGNSVVPQVMAALTRANLG